jgi:hypothetical protein
MNNADDIPQSERRRIMLEERRGRTYQGHAIVSADEDRGGRYANAGNSTTVVGARPISYPQQPATSPFACDPVGPEPPLGYAIDAQEPVGEMFERTSAPVAPAVEGMGGGHSDVVSATQPFKRRA